MLLALLLACHGADPPGGKDAGTNPSTDALGTGLEPGELRRLTESAYRHTVRDLFPGVAMPEITLVADPLVNGFDNNGETQAPSALLVGQLHDAALAVAAAAGGSPDLAFGCPAGGGPDPAGCGAAFLAAFGPRVFRRPLTEAELAEATGLFEELRATDGFDVAIQVAVVAWLESPEFLYFPEFGVDPAGADVVPLDDWERAARLSYFLWDSMPDAALFAAAEAHALDTPEGVAAQAERMLADPKAADGVDDFFRLWLALDKLDTITVDAATYPSFDEELRAAMKAETVAFARRQALEGTLDGLLTDPTAELTPETAALYGVPDPGPGQLTTLPPDQRAGILTRAAFLATRAHAVNPSPVKRGVFVLDNLLCTPPAPPPPGVNTAVPDGSTGEPSTNRERYAEHTDRPECSGCHIPIDGIGFGFENFDSLGAWRDVDGGFPVDATGSFHSRDLVDVTFDGPIEASALLAGSRGVADCVAEGWIRYALGRSLGEGDEATIAALQQAFTDAGTDFHALRLALVQSDAFLDRRAP